MSALAGADKHNIVMTALQQLIHFMKQDLLPLEVTLRSVIVVAAVGG